MNNLIQNYEIILKILQSTCSDIFSIKQYHLPKLSDIELVELNFTAEYMSYNSELQLFRAIQNTYLEAQIERSVFNKRKRNLFTYFEAV